MRKFLIFSYKIRLYLHFSVHPVSTRLSVCHISIWAY
nr:MAG TPA: hypothetical protein [Caudoviricetes sp.]